MHGIQLRARVGAPSRLAALPGAHHYLPLLVATLLAGCGDSDAPLSAPTAIDISSYTVPLPPEVTSARAPAFVAADGSDLLFSFSGPGTKGQELGYIRLDGSGFRCLSCDSSLNGHEPQPFRDGRRVFLQQGENQSSGQADYVIVECRPSLADCRQSSSKPVLGLGDSSSLQDRVPKLSPDERWLLSTRIRIDGYFMMLGHLVEQSDHYQVEDLLVVNPPADPAKGEIDQLSVTGTVYEAKGIGTDGRTMTFAATLGEAMNFDWFALDLPTGAVRRLTRDPDWDEGSQPSPGMQYFRGASARGREVTAALGNLPRPSLFDFALMGPVFNYYLPRSLPVPIPGRERKELLRPFLLPAGEAAGVGGEGGFQLSRQDEEDGWLSNGGSGGWSADGRKILNAQKREDGQTRLRIYTLEQQPAYLEPPRALQMPDWARPISEFPVRPRHLLRRVSGPGGGTALVSLQGTQLAGVFSVQYSDYSVDGCSKLNGHQIVTLTGVLIGSLVENLRLSGCHQGYSRIRVAFADLLTTGSAESDYDGRVYAIGYRP
jgi:hypothetical protein